MIAPNLRQNAPQSFAQAEVPQVDLERKRLMKEAFKAYRGEFPDPLTVDKDQPNDNVKPNRCGSIVAKGVSFLFGPVLKIEATDEKIEEPDAPPSPDEHDPTALPVEKPKAPTPIQDYLNGLWGDDDDKMSLLADLGINGGVCGQTFVKLIPAKGSMKYPRMVVMNPEIIRPITDPEDVSLILAFVVEYPTNGEWQKRQIVARVDPDNTDIMAGEYDLDDTWTTTTYVRKGQYGRWTQTCGVDVWPYPFAPIFTCKNLPNPNEPWGEPDLTPDLIELNKSINFEKTNINRIIKYHGHPVTYATGMRAEQISVALNEVLCLPDPTSKLDKLAAMDNFSGLLAVVQDLRSDMDERSRVPATALGREETLPKGNISGVALKLLLQPIIEKTLMKQRLYGRLIREICRAALVIANLIPVESFEDYKIGLGWMNLLPVDDLLAAQTGQILIDAVGVSQGTVMQELGYDAEDEAKKTAIESARKQAAMPQPQPMQPGMPGQPPNTAQSPQDGQQTAQTGGQ